MPDNLKEKYSGNSGFKSADQAICDHFDYDP